jgi:hypothetical protein
MAITCLDTAKGGHCPFLRYARAPWHREATLWAAEGGHLECLRCAHEHGAPWHGSTTSFAASGGHLECLRYAHEHGAPWHEETMYAAARRGHLECLRYAVLRQHVSIAHVVTPFANWFRQMAWHDLTPKHAVQKRSEFLAAVWRIAKLRLALSWAVAAFRRRAQRRRAAAAAIIQRAWLDACYRPGGRGADAAAERWHERARTDSY